MSRPRHLPPLDQMPEPVRDAADRLREMEIAAQQANAAHERLTRGKSAAEDKDRQAAADALLEGKPMPAAKHAAEHEKDVAASRRTVDAHRVAAERLRQDLDDAIEEHRGAWAAENEKTLATALADAKSAADALAESIAVVEIGLGNRAFLNHDDPDNPVSWRTRPLQTSMRSRGGDPAGVASLVDALREVIDRVENPPPTRAELRAERKASRATHLHAA